MRRTSVKLIIKLTEKFYISIIAQTSQMQKTKRGRPRKYSDLLILYKEMLSLSLRETLLIASDYFEKVPSLRDFHYRLSKLDEDLIKRLIKEIHDTVQRNTYSSMVDGTGFGYKREAYLNWMRGTQVRKVKDHIRCEIWGCIKKLIREIKNLTDRR